MLFFVCFFRFIHMVNSTLALWIETWLVTFSLLTSFSEPCFYSKRVYVTACFTVPYIIITSTPLSPCSYIVASLSCTPCQPEAYTHVVTVICCLSTLCNISCGEAVCSWPWLVAILLCLSEIVIGCRAGVFLACCGISNGFYAVLSLVFVYK